MLLAKRKIKTKVVRIIIGMSLQKKMNNGDKERNNNKKELMNNDALTSLVYYLGQHYTPSCSVIHFHF